MKNIVLSAAAVVSATVLASPSVSIVATRQDAATRVVTVDYRLSVEPAVVTLGVETNRGDGVWIPIGDEHVQGASGDVNRLVQIGDRSIEWRPDRSWPNHRITDNSFRIGVVAWATNAPPDYMVVDLQKSGVVRYYQSAAAVPWGVTNAEYKTNQLLMRKIPAAGVEWNMGSNSQEPGRSSNESIHRVMLTKDYYIGVYEVTRRQYWLISGSSPSTSPVFPGDAADQCPVDKVVWNTLRGSSVWPGSGHNLGSGCVLQKLRNHVGGGILFDLPTEAQWEYACRAGSGYAFNNGGDTEDFMKNAGWCKENAGLYSGSQYYAHAVGGKEPNAWGLYDMHGNVWEFCLDYYGGGDYTDISSLLVDPEGPASKTYRIRRGGDKGRSYTFARCASRTEEGPNGVDERNGFRIACEAVAQ